MRLAFKDFAAVTRARTDNPVQFHGDVEVMVGSRLYKVHSHLGRVSPVIQSREADRRHCIRNIFQAKDGNILPMSAGNVQGANRLQRIIFEEFGALREAHL